MYKVVITYENAQVISTYNNEQRALEFANRVARHDEWALDIEVMTTADRR